MASTVVAELEGGLQAMLALKPPGVSGSRITNITTLCVSNVQKAPGTHKLGVLYVVDSVTRKWLDQAKTQGQTPSLSAPDGTFAAGVHRVTELIPILMNDILSTAPEDQKEKIRKLVDIWDKGQTFPPSMVNSFKEKLNGSRPAIESTTPPGSPPPNLLASLGLGSKPADSRANPAIPNILDTLANIARQNASSAQNIPNLAAPAPAPAPTLATAPVFTTSGMMPHTLAPVQAPPSVPFLLTSQPATPPPVNVPGLPYSFPPQMPPQPAPQPAPAAGANNPAAATVQLVAALAAQGIPIDKIASVIQMMGQAGSLPAAAAPPQMPQPSHTGYATPTSVGGVLPGPAPWEAPRPDDSHDRYHDGMPNRPRGRSRSRSPPRWDGRGSPRSSRANDRGGFGYGRPGSPGRGPPDGRDSRMPDYRQRSPQGRHGDSPGREPPQGEKWVEYDNNLPSGCIKVYSRTLFVGGVTCSENELRNLFARYGHVQTCIVHRDKRHAFVKMFTRKDAERAKEAMQEARNNQEFDLRTRWGVGFGPRDCSDYPTGVQDAD
ncbi:hypothetical protein N0V88_000496 [Collariella sp. IMI 366227]|nr:hypothetical protein N0V88_000496 [Collariella sp. IMI 366227]